jgi:RimJ/RimL family protein N-acetyltransferase
MFTIIDFAPLEAAAQAWKDYYYFYKVTTGNFPRLDAFKTRIQQNTSEKGTKFKLIYKGEILVCSVELTVKSAVGGGNIPRLSFVCGPAELPPGFDTAIADTILQFNELYPAGNWQVVSASPVIQDIAFQFGWEVSDRINFYELSRQDYDTATVTTLKSNPIIESKALRPVFYDYIPEQLFNQFAELMTMLMNDIVRENPMERFNETAAGVAKKMSRFKQADVKMLALLLFDNYQNIAGMSFILKHPDSPALNQEMTGLTREWRGKKLAAWLKAAITNEAFKRFPAVEKIETNCYAANKAIIRLNGRLGYQLKYESLQFEIRVDDLVQFTL